MASGTAGGEARGSPLALMVSNRTKSEISTLVIEEKKSKEQKVKQNKGKKEKEWTIFLKRKIQKKNKQKNKQTMVDEKAKAGKTDEN